MLDVLVDSSLGLVLVCALLATLVVLLAVLLGWVTDASRHGDVNRDQH